MILYICCIMPRGRLARRKAAQYGGAPFRPCGPYRYSLNNLNSQK